MARIPTKIIIIRKYDDELGAEKEIYLIRGIAVKMKKEKNKPQGVK